MFDLKFLAIAFALAGLGAAIRAAHLWWKSANAPVLPETAASISDVSELHIMSAQSAMFISAGLNQRAAKWTGVAAVSSALGSVFGVL
jgi:hypothetical protein